MNSKVITLILLAKPMDLSRSGFYKNCCSGLPTACPVSVSSWTKPHNLPLSLWNGIQYILFLLFQHLFCYHHCQQSHSEAHNLQILSRPLSPASNNTPVPSTQANVKLQEKPQLIKANNLWSHLYSWHEQWLSLAIIGDCNFRILFYIIQVLDNGMNYFNNQEGDDLHKYEPIKSEIKGKKQIL